MRANVTACGCFFAFLFACNSGPADATTPNVIAIQVIDGTNLGITGLRQLQSGVGANQYWFAAGYHSPLGGGGGIFYTGQGAPVLCPSVTFNNVSWTAGVTTISLPNVTGLSVGMAVATPLLNGLPQFDMIVSVNSATNMITLAVPPTLSSSANIAFSPDNGGSVIVDSERTPHCFFRSSYTYSPLEWGAYENFVPANSPSGTDDTIALGNWMNATQPHIAVPGASVISAPLICNDGGIIQGAPTGGAPEATETQTIPSFTIYAPKTGGFPFIGSAMLIMSATNLQGTGPARCAIHGVGLIADGQHDFDTVHALGTGDLIADHSYLASGNYNVVDGPTTSNLQIYDSSINGSYSHGLNLQSSHIRISRNSIAGAGAHGSHTGDDINIQSAGQSDILITDNIIQQAYGWGINAAGAHQLRIMSNYIDNNARGSAGSPGAIEIGAGTSQVSLCDNIFHRTGAGLEPFNPNSATYHMYFAGRVDGISLCGNTYFPGLTSNPIPVRPDYDYNADPLTAQPTNVSIADNPAPQNFGVYFPPNATSLLQGANLPQIPNNFLSGLTLSYEGTTSVSVAPGAAADSTNSVVMTLPSSCPIGFTNPAGLNGLDTGGSAARNTTYYVFLVAGPSGAAPSCMASASPTPTFANVQAYQLQQPADTMQNSNGIYNFGSDLMSAGLPFNPLAGMAKNATVTGLPFTSSASITSTTAFFMGWTGTTTKGSPIVNFSSSPVPLGGVGISMPVQDQTDQLQPNQTIPPGTVVTGICNTSCTAGTTCGAGYSYCVLLSQNATAGQNCDMCTVTISFSGNYSISVNPVASTSRTQKQLTVRGGLYRLLGALYTDGSGNIVNFTQENDTFYLAQSVPDIETGSSPLCALGTSPQLCALSVPCGRTAATCGSTGIKVEAFGRIVGGLNNLLLSSADQPAQIPTAFPGPPGYTVDSATTSTAAPFRLYTDTTGEVLVQGSSSASTIYEVTDGWVFHRGE